MITVDLLTIKLQEILGRQYSVFSQHAFEAKFTQTTQTPYGAQQDIAWQAFEAHMDDIVTVVTVGNPVLTDVPYTLQQSTYEVRFWVPLDIFKTDENGQLLEDPPFDFFADMERLTAAVTNKDVSFGESLRGRMTMGEPLLLSNQPDDSGSFRRLIFSVSGNVSIAEGDVGTGGDIQISIVVNGQESFFENFTGFTLGASTDSNSIQDSNDPFAKSEVAILGQQIDFTMDDYITNDAMRLVERKVWEALEILTPDAEDEVNRKKVYTRLYKGGAVRAEFWGILAAQYNVSGVAGFGRYEVSILNSGEGDGDAGE